MKKSTIVMALGATLALGACGSSVENRAGTGGLSGAAAGAVVGGPVGAVIGGAGGAYAGATMDEGVENKVPSVSEIRNAVTGDGGSSQASSSRSAGSGHASLSRQEVRTVQRELREDGHRIAVDGIWGPNTERALRDFQQANGLDASGEVDERTMAALREDRPAGSAGTTGNTGGGTGTTGATTSNTTTGGTGPAGGPPSNSPTGGSQPGGASGGSGAGGSAGQ